MSTSFSDDLPTLELLLDRLESIEARLNAVEAHPVAAAGDISLADLDLRMKQQTTDIETLQVQLSETRQKVAVEVTTVERRLDQVAREIPAILESLLETMLETTLGPRVEDLRARLRAETLESVEATLARFEQTIDSKVSVRVSTLEKALIDQAAIVTTLSQRAVEAELNLQRLIAAVEKLCERTDARPAAPFAATPAIEPSFLELPFERHLSEAIKRQPEPPAQPSDSGFRPRIVKEDEDKLRPRHRLSPFRG